MSLSDVIRAARRKAGLSQPELARRMSVSNGAVAHWETGNFTPSLANMMKLRDKLGIPIGGDPSPGAQHGYRFVEDPEQLAWLALFDELDPSDRIKVARMVRSLLAFPEPKPDETA